MPTLDIIGEKFNRLLVISREGSDKKRSALYKCQCDCGKTKILPGYRVRNNEIKSCGCYHKEQTSKALRYTNLLGKRFGQLLVIERYHQNSNGKTLWICLCSCGSIKKIVTNYLLSGNTKSCGCRSRGSQTHGTIYGIYKKGTDDLVYIGQTVKYKLKDRLKGHKIHCKNNELKSWLNNNESEIRPLIENVKIENLNMMEKALIKIITKEYHDLLNIRHIS